MEIKILITGGTGFVGANLVDALLGHDLVLMQRHPSERGHANIIRSLDSNFNYVQDMAEVDVVVHSAALLPETNDGRKPSRKEYLEVNAYSTENLARCASMAGVKHFIFISSIKVHGELSPVNRPFQWDDPYFPQDDYSSSKMIAELRLKELDEVCDMRISIIRAPLIYGPGVKANFARILNWSTTPIPFPINSKFGRRSLLSIWNLGSLVKNLAETRPSVSRVYLASDGTDHATHELLGFMASAQNKRLSAVWMPIFLIKTVLTMLGLRHVYYKLFGSLQIDIKPTMQSLSWVPIHNTREGMARMIAAEVEVSDKLKD